MWSDFTVLSGDAWAAAVRTWARICPPKTRWYPMSRFWPSTTPGSTSVRSRQATSASWSKRHQPSLERSRAPAIGPPPLATAATSTSFGHLALAGLAAHLEDGLVDEAEAVEPAGRQLAAVGVERQLALARDAVAALDERAALALAAEAERLEPRHGEEAEAVVELGDVDVGWA